MRRVLAPLAAIVVGIPLGIDNARDAGIHPSIIVEDKSVRRRWGPDGGDGGVGERSLQPLWRKTLAVTSNGRRQSFIWFAGRKVP